MRAQHASDTFDYFYNEYKVAQRCAMRNICKMISFYEPPSPNVDKDYFLFMEYCDMGSMKDCIIKHKQALYIPSPLMHNERVVAILFVSLTWSIGILCLKYFFGTRFFHLLVHSE